MDRFTAIAALLQQTGCGGHKLRWISVPQVRSDLGVGSTFEFRAVADAIRQEIGVLAEEGKLARVFEQWGYMSGQDVASVESLLNARRREVRLICGHAGLRTDARARLLADPAAHARKKPDAPD